MPEDDANEEQAVKSLLSLPTLHNFEMRDGDGDKTLRGGVLFLMRVGDDTSWDALSMMILLTDCHWLGLFFPPAGNDE